MRAGRIQRQLTAELPDIEEVTPRRATELEVQPAEELRLGADATPRTGARAAAAIAAPIVPALPLAPASAAGALAASARRLRAGLDPGALAALDAPARTALAPRLEAAIAMFREAAVLTGLREQATSLLRTGRRA